MAKSKNEVVEAKVNELSTEVDIDFAADAGAGTEGADKSSFAIPFLTVLQGLSPQVQDDGVDGAKPGLLINTITNEVFKEALIIPCAFQRKYLRWAPRDQGGGYRGEYSAIEIETGRRETEKGKDGKITIEGDELKDTRNHFVLVQTAEGAWQPALISLSSTQIKKSKRLLSLVRSIEIKTPEGRTVNPASFSHIYKVRTVKEENSKGKWFGIEFDIVDKVKDKELYEKAKAFHKSVTEGEVEVSQPDQEVYEDDARF